MNYIQKNNKNEISKIINKLNLYHYIFIKKNINSYQDNNYNIKIIIARK